MKAGAAQFWEAAYQGVLVDFAIGRDHGLDHELVTVFLVGIVLERLEANWKGEKQVKIDEIATDLTSGVAHLKSGLTRWGR